MTEEVRGAITSDKVETDNTNFATVRADQTCEEVLLPRENAIRQLNWQVTLEKGSVYNPPEDVGVYAQEVDCKYGVQVDGDVFGRNAISIEHGAASHDGEPVGARVFGSLLSEGQVDVVEPGSKLDDWQPQPVTVYGDVFGGHVTFEEPTVVYGSVKADQTLRVNAPTVVLGTVHSEGIVEATDLFAFSVVAEGDVTLGADVAVVNPQVRSVAGSVTIADRVGIFTPEVFDVVRERMDVDAVGPWVFDVDAVWERNALVPADVHPRGDGELATRAWRTVEERSREQYESVRQQFRAMARATRDDPPDIEEFRYDGLADMGGGDGGLTVEGDVVVGEQDKTVEDTDVTTVDQSTTQVDQSNEVHDHSTTVEDSVVNRSDIGDDSGTPASLEDISGVGSTKAESLRAAGYESVADVRAAPAADLAEVEGIGPALAERMKSDVGEE